MLNFTRNGMVFASPRAGSGGAIAKSFAGHAGAEVVLLTYHGGVDGRLHQKVTR
jgi:hypothetical protein